MQHSQCAADLQGNTNSAIILNAIIVTSRVAPLLQLGVGKVPKEIPVTDHRNPSHSQNFLRSSLLVVSLLDKTDIDHNDFVVEIGPGRGLVTRELAKRSNRVLAVEIDAALVARLRIALVGLANVSVVEGDFLQWQLPVEPYKVFASIPYNITADIMGKLLEGGNPPSVAYLIMQDKAAVRFIGSPLAKNTQMSILLQPWFEMGALAEIDRRQFVPTPKVDAVLAFFRKRMSPLVPPQLRQAFRDFVIFGYNQWQPTILDSYHRVFTRPQRVIISKELGIEAAKPSDLDLNQWLALFDTFLLRVPASRKALVTGAELRLKRQQQGLTKLHRTR